jgi:hypothetical protein
MRATSTLVTLAEAWLGAKEFPWAETQSNAAR